MSYERICSPPEPPLCVLLFIKKQSSSPRGIVVKTSTAMGEILASLFNEALFRKRFFLRSRQYIIKSCSDILYQFYRGRLINIILTLFAFHANAMDQI